MTRHHVRPRSQGGKWQKINIVKVPQGKHNAYHYLFGNRTPEQIMEYLMKDWGFEKYFKSKGIKYTTERSVK